MKKKLSIVTLFITALYFSQSTGIGTTNPDTSAILEISSNNKGIIIPRVGLSSSTDTSTIPSPALSLLVYNNRSLNDVTPGYYYWDSQRWVRFRDSNTNIETVRNGTTNPTLAIGNLGDFYINTSNNTIYGPKTTLSWGNPTSLVGSQGATGPQGATGSQGPQGPQGSTGATGPQGIQGPVGPEPWYSTTTNTGATSNIENIYQMGKVGINNTNPLFNADIVGKMRIVNNNDYSNFYSETFSNNMDIHAPVILTRARGTSTAPSYPQAYDALGSIDFRDAIDSKKTSEWGGASIYGQAAENFSSLAKGTNILFKTTNVGTNFETEKMRITANGNVGIGTNFPNSNSILDLYSVNKGLLLPRVSDATMNSTLLNANEGTQIYNTDRKCNYIKTNIGWRSNCSESQQSKVFASHMPNSQFKEYSSGPNSRTFFFAYRGSESIQTTIPSTMVDFSDFPWTGGSFNLRFSETGIYLVVFTFTGVLKFANSDIRDMITTTRFYTVANSSISAAIPDSWNYYFAKANTLGNGLYRYSSSITGIVIVRDLTSPVLTPYLETTGSPITVDEWNDAYTFMGSNAGAAVKLWVSVVKVSAL